MPFKIIEEYLCKSKLSLEELCKLFAVSRSGYYTYLTRSNCKTDETEDKLICLIKDIYFKSKCRYGYRRIRDTLTTTYAMVISYKKSIALNESNWH